MQFILRFILCFLGVCLCLSACKTVSTTSETVGNSKEISVDNSGSGPSPNRNQLIRDKEAGIREYRSSRERDFDLLHTELKVGFDYTSQKVIGEAILTLKPFIYPQEELVLDAKDFDVHTTSLLADGKPIPLVYSYDQKKLTLFLPEKWNEMIP